MAVGNDAASHSRADARRNRAKILGVASRALAAGGLSVSLGQIARQAGVGAGTVYRHFPTKDALLEAVLSQRIEQLTRLALRYRSQGRPGRALFEFLREVVDGSATRKDLCEAFQADNGWPRTVFSAAGQRFGVALEALLHDAQRAGAVRGDVDATDVQALVTGCVAIRRSHPDRPFLTDLILGSIQGCDETRDETMSRSPLDPARTCPICGRSVARNRSGRPARYCSPACRQKAHRRRVKSSGAH